MTEPKPDKKRGGNQPGPHGRKTRRAGARLAPRPPRMAPPPRGHTSNTAGGHRGGRPPPTPRARAVPRKEAPRARPTAKRTILGVFPERPMVTPVATGRPSRSRSRSRQHRGRWWRAAPPPSPVRGPAALTGRDPDGDPRSSGLLFGWGPSFGVILQLGACQNRVLIGRQTRSRRAHRNRPKRS